MNNRLLSIFLVTLFITSALIAVPEASAHFTLGAQGTAGPTSPQGGLPWLSAPFQASLYGMPGAHANGHLAYVQPGSLYAPPNAQANYYSPNGSVLVDTVGDLKFYINVSVYNAEYPTTSGAINISGCGPKFLYIAIPPEFTPPVDWTVGSADYETTNRGRGDSSNVDTSITNDHRFIQVGKFASNHQIAPNWWYVRISAPNTTYPAPYPANWWPSESAATRTIGDTDGDDAADEYSSELLYPPGCDPWLDRQDRTGSFKGCYSVTVKDMVAPSCAGKYFFKVFYVRSLLSGGYYWKGSWDPVGSCLETYTSFDARNYPVLLVKGEVDPGYISGTLRYCGHSTYYYGYYYGEAITGVAGKVSAVGTALDPVTNEPIDREVCGVAYFNSTASGFYQLEGLAPGTYTLTACAAGFISKTLDTKITVKRGQSIHGVDICLQPGPKLKVKIFSKCPTGIINWPDYVTMKIEPANSYAVLGDRLTPAQTANAPIRIEIIDADGNVKKGYYTTFDNTVHTSDTGEILIGDSSCYRGIDIATDGHVPQVNATNTCGLEPGTYTIKAYVFGYVQTEEYSVTLPGTEFAGSVYAEMDLYKGGTVTATVHFHDQEMPSDDKPIRTDSNRLVLIEAYDSGDVLRAFNYSVATVGSQTWSLELIGDSNYWMHSGHIYGMPEDTYTFKIYSQGYVQQEFPMHTVSLCSDSSFSFHLIRGATINATLYSRDWQNPSNAIYWKHPRSKILVALYDSTGTKKDDRTVYQLSGANTVANVAIIGGTGSTSCGYYETVSRPSGLATDIYTIKAFTVGYVMKEIPEVAAMKGSSTGDIPLYLYVGGKIIVVVDYKIEELPATLGTSAWSHYVRIKALDEDGNLAAANITAVPSASSYTVSQWPWAGTLNPAQPYGVQTWVFELDGFNRFTTPINTANVSGNAPGYNCPSCKYGYFEPGVTKADEWKGNYWDYGIPAGTYTITVDGPSGYIQLLTVTAVVNWNGVTTVVFEMDKGASVSGFVWTKNWMRDYRAASWIKVSATSGSGSKSTESRDGPYSISGLKPDTWAVTAELTPPGGDAGYVSSSMSVTTTWGGTSSVGAFYLEESGIPIPEFPMAILALISALAASLFLIRWRRETIVLGK